MRLRGKECFLRLSFLSPFVIACIALFFSAFYFHPNMGGEGLFIPLNSIVWIATAFVILLAVWRMWQQQTIRMPAFFGLILAMPMLILLTGFIVGMEQPLSWMLRISAILLGFLLFFGLFQFKTSRRDVNSCLYVLCGALSLHAVVGVIQLLPGALLSNFIPNVYDPISIGMFQQPNVQASLMATAIALSVYLISSPDFRGRPVWVKSLPLICLLLSTFALMSSDSRVGLLGGSGALVLILLSRFSLLKLRRGWALGMLLVLLAGGGSGLIINDGALRAYSKIEQLSGQGQDIRKDVYRISWEIIKDKPLLGHGIGSFQQVFHEKAAEYQLKTDGFNLGLWFSHPHNELLLWGIEGGAVGLLAFLFAIVAVLCQLICLGWQRGGAMAALLLPIALHTQVEHPFYVSAYHWVMFLFLLFVVFNQSGSKVYPLRVSFAAGALIRGLSIMLMLVVLWFCTTSLYYSNRIVHMLYSDKAKLAELNAIQQHPYFSEVATRLLLAHFSEAEKLSKGTSVTLEYVEWLEVYIKHVPDIGVFIDLIRAYAYLGDSEKEQATIDRALYLYRGHPLILKTAKEVKEKYSVD
ncbi:O-antigen polymerase [Neptunomonas qingdaonensis]|uniref:O-antigen polymerase n=1 Tax=Neptunomonas qingdaonensis TaxID=1045558 RepID=A0A1I2TJF4_9GAMM|nr:O-antigen polymerase [Neptunomonas qingdaonensis]